jgi:pseudaminic acid synthase
MKKRWQGARVKNNYPEIVAELSGNHNGSLDRALDLIRIAKDSGADAIKFQTYTAETMTLKVDRPEFVISEETSLWRDRDLYSLYEVASTPWEWHPELFRFAREIGIEPFSTPFDPTAVDFLQSLEVTRFKIASFEITYLDLIAKAAKTGKPLIISTGMATFEEVSDAVDTARDNGCRDLTLLKCTSAYPSDPKFANLSTIADLRDRFKCPVGLSDHTLGISVALGAVALGATMIEKHITFDHNDGGVDSKFSLSPSELKSLVEESRIVADSLGEVSYGVSDLERPSLRFRRSIIIVDNVKPGDLVSEQNTRILRPGHGLPPKHFESMLGKRFKVDLKIGDVLSFEDLE